MMKMEQTLTEVERCPQCGIAKPQLLRLWEDAFIPEGEGSQIGFRWSIYSCTSCKLLIMAKSYLGERNSKICTLCETTFPSSKTSANELPNQARSYLQQAMESLHAPDGAAMLAGSAVDAMLKEKGLNNGSLYTRIDKAVDDGILTIDMADWAHDVRLGSNRPRHVDNDDPHVTPEDANQSVEFAETLGHILFVIPERIRRGRAKIVDENEA